jgi:hypothetical protein
MAGYTQLTAGFTQPAAAANVTISVSDSSWMSPTQVVYIQSAGYFEVQSLPDATSAIVQNLDYAGNAVATTAIANGQGVSPAGIRGVAGAAGSATFSGASGLSPTTTKGDIIVDNGASSPNPSAIRVAVGTNGQMLSADSGTASGVDWKTTIPVTVTNDNNIPRFNGTSGNPVPLQDSGLLISDTGAIQSTPTGGNARGASAVDLQVVRAAATQVASGDNSVVAGGENNTASSNHTTVGGGADNSATSSIATVAGGNANTASGNYSTIGGGDGNTATGSGSTVSGGSSNDATGLNSTVVGGDACNATATVSISGGSLNTSSGTGAVTFGAQNDATANYSAVTSGFQATADKYGQVARASGRFAADADAQTSELILRIATTNATPATMFLDGSSARATISSGSTWTFSALVVGRRDNGDSASWKFEGAIHNNGGTTALIGAVTATLIGADAGCSGTWGVAGSIAVTADNANDALQVQVTGTAANNIRWVCWIRTVEVNY